MSLSRRVSKLFNIDIKSVDETNRTITFCFSDDQPDREGEVVDQSTWDVKNYMLNPIILWGHDSSVNDNVLGQGVSLDLNNNGKSYITAQFDDVQTNPRADTIFRQLVKRTLRCVSAGFINHTYDTQADTVILKDNELLEVSVVAIPANPRAIALSLKEGTLSTKDAKWMMDSMRSEADFLEKQYKAETKKLETKSMTDEQAAAIVEGLGKLTETVEALKTDNQSLKDDIASLKPPVETEEEKTAREAKEAADAAELAAKAEADKKAADEAEAARVKAEEDAKNAAKDGSDDQSGASEDGEIDEDAELTPELQAQIDAELEATNAQ